MEVNIRQKEQTVAAFRLRRVSLEFSATSALFVPVARRPPSIFLAVRPRRKSNEAEDATLTLPTHLTLLPRPLSCQRQQQGGSIDRQDNESTNVSPAWQSTCKRTLKESLSLHLRLMSCSFLTCPTAWRRSCCSCSRVAGRPARRRCRRRSRRSGCGSSGTPSPS